MTTSNQPSHFGDAEQFGEYELVEQVRYWNAYINPGYRPDFEIVERAEVRVTFWGIANHTMKEYYDERR
ncbi:MAG: hypothetical protein GXP42_04425 [Chloroflexi bacterium]|nr:hypothetical protein [Chloroflexota bacterium]